MLPQSAYYLVPRAGMTTMAGKINEELDTVRGQLPLIERTKSMLNCMLLVDNAVGSFAGSET